MPHHTREAIKYERVNKHIVWYSQHRDYLHQVAERARPYLYHIVESLGKHKLPYELALLPIVESAISQLRNRPKALPDSGNSFQALAMISTCIKVIIMMPDLISPPLLKPQYAICLSSNSISMATGCLPSLHTTVVWE